jgi:hypothetical protein
MKRITVWAMKFDRKNRCGWVAAWKSRCRALHAKLRKFVKKVYRMRVYAKMTLKARRNYWRKVGIWVLRRNRVNKCHMVSKRWRKTVRAAKVLRKRGYGYMLLRK